MDKTLATLFENQSEGKTLRTYHVSCPDCLKIMSIEMEDGDPRRNANSKFFVIICEHCGHHWQAKIFETLNVYPFAIIEDKK